MIRNADSKDKLILLQMESKTLRDIELEVTYITFCQRTCIYLPILRIYQSLS